MMGILTGEAWSICGLMQVDQRYRPKRLQIWRSPGRVMVSLGEVFGAQLIISTDDDSSMETLRRPVAFLFDCFLI